MTPAIEMELAVAGYLRRHSSYYAEYAVTYDNPWRYGELPDVAVTLSQNGYRELCRCVSATTGPELNYAEVIQVSPFLASLAKRFLVYGATVRPSDTAQTVQR